MGQPHGERLGGMTEPDCTLDPGHAETRPPQPAKLEPRPVWEERTQYSIVAVMFAFVFSLNRAITC